MSALPFLLAMLASAAAPAAPSSADAPPARRDEWQFLDRHFTVDGFSEDRPPPDGGFDGMQNAFHPAGLPAGERLTVGSRRYGEVQFRRPPTDGDRPNFVACQGQRIAITTRRAFNVLFSLGSAYHGPLFGWVEFEHEDGSVTRGPIGYSDWYFEPVLGEETAFLLQPVGNAPEPGSGVRIWLQATPIPSEKRIVALRLPIEPKMRILALTLGWRDGVSAKSLPAPGRPGPGPVGIFGEPSFPHYDVRGDLTPERIRSGFSEAGIEASILRLEHLADPEILTPAAYPVLVIPYGNTYPADAESSLRAYRKAGGCMVHLANPLHHPVLRSPWGTWIDQGTADGNLPHEGTGLGVGGFRFVGGVDPVGEPILDAWGLAGVDWSRQLARGPDLPPRTTFQPTVIPAATLAPTDEVTPLLGAKGIPGEPFAAIIRHRSCAFEGAVDVRLGAIASGLEPSAGPVSLAVELIVRASAAILKEKSRIDEAAWLRATRPIPEDLRAPRPPDAVMPAVTEDGRLPRTESLGRKVAWTRVDGLDERTRVLLASAQGLVNRAAGERSVFLSHGDEDDARLERYRAAGLVDSPLERVEPDRVLDLVGHRRAVIVDDEVHGSLNLAVMVAAAEGLLVAYPEHAARFRLEAAADLRGLFATGAEGYLFALEGVVPKLSRRAVALLRPEARHHASIDYLIAGRLPVAWFVVGWEMQCPGASRFAEIAAVAKLLASLPVGIPAVTNPSTEEDGPAFLSRFGKHRIAVDGLANLSFTSGLRPELRRGAAAAPGSPTGGAAAAPGSAPPVPAPAGAAPGTAIPAPGAKLHAACVDPSAEDLARLPALAAAQPLVPGAETGMPVVAGRVIPPAAFDLLPAEVAAVLGGLREGEDLGSAGLGEVRLAALGSAYGAEDAARVADAWWERTDRSLRDLGQTFFVLRDWTSPWGPEVEEAARRLSAAEIILVEARSGVQVAPDASARMVAGRPVLHATVAALEALRVPTVSKAVAESGRPAFTWAPLRAPAARREMLAAAMGATGAAVRTVRTPRPRALPPDLVLMTPREMAALCREHLARTALEPVLLIEAGASWRYHDKGEDLGTAWRAVDQDDASWAEGKAELGYGEAGEGRPEATVVGFGPDPQSKHPTTYFRRAIDIPEPWRYESLSLEVLSDDGCVVYLNGEEVARPNLPAGDISYSTWAARPVGDAEELAWHSAAAGASLLRRGKNVVAVEVHQSGATSSDLSFDLKLTGLRKPAPPPPR